MSTPEQSQNREQMTELLSLGNRDHEHERDHDHEFERGHEYDVLEGTNYRVLELLGQGGMGAVYLAEHRDLGRRFAVKMLRADLHPTTEMVERLRREARAASQIRHSGVVDVTDFGTTREGRPFVVMEHLEGQTLGQVIDESGGLDQAKAVDFGLALCDALAAVHSQDVIHRDIKPENVLLVQNDQGEQVLKLVDFGLALSPEHFGERLTRHGAIFGTPEYISPEQVRGRPLTTASDVYSLGVVLYELLTGQPPFMGDSSVDIMAAKLRDDVVPLRQAMPGTEIHPELERCVVRCLERQPQDRYESALEVAEALSEIRDELRGVGSTGPAIAAPAIAPAESMGLSAEEQPRRRGWSLISVVLVVVVVVVIGMSAWSMYGRGDDSAADRSVDNDRAVASLTPQGAPSETERLPVEVEPREPGPTERVDEPSSGEALEVPEPRADERVETTDAPVKRQRTSRAPRGERQSSTTGASQGQSASSLIAEGHQLLSARHYSRARQAFERAATLNPGSAAAQSGLGRVAFQQQRYDAAANHLGRALRARPGDHSTRVLYGSVLLRLGRRAEAIREWERVLAADPNHRAARRSLDAIR